MMMTGTTEIVPLRTSQPDQDVWARLDLRRVGGKEDGWEVPRATLGNVVIILEHDPRWAGRLGWSEFDGRAQQQQDGRWMPITDEMETEAALWLDSVYQLQMGTPRVGEAMRAIAARHPYHPVREYLEGLTWDETERLPGYCSAYLGAADTPMAQVLGVRWFVGAVARVMRPGCKLDTTLILVGPQEAGKSTSFRALVPEEDWFSDTLIDFRSKDAYQSIQGVWLYELAELDTLRRSDNSAVKAFLSAQQDRYRRAYGRNVVTVPRQCVFVGSTNEAEFLSDPTGSRRFWPVRVSAGIRLDEIARVRDQLWAEAMVRYRQGQQWWLTREESVGLRSDSALYRQVDSWEEIIGEWVDAQLAMGRGSVTVREIMSRGLEIEAGQQKRGDQMRIAGILAGLGLEKQRVQRGGRRHVVWTRPPRD